VLLLLLLVASYGLKLAQESAHERVGQRAGLEHVLVDARRKEAFRRAPALADLVVVLLLVRVLLVLLLLLDPAGCCPCRVGHGQRE